MTQRASRHRLRWQLLTAFVALALVAAACGKSNDKNSSTTDTTKTSAGANEGTPKKGGTLTFGVESETNNYAPHLFAGTQAGYIAALSVYDPLVVHDKDGNVVPYLAESVTPNADLSEYTVKLRPNVKFHDGTDLTADVMKADYDEFIANKDQGTVRTSEIKDVTSVQVVDNLTYKYVLNGPNAAFEDILTGPVGWAFSITAARAAPKDFGSKPVGTGPFIFDHWQRDGEFVANRNPNYWQKGLPYLDKIVIKPIPDEDARLAALQAGDIDATHSVRLSQFLTEVRNLANGGKVKMFEGPGNSGSGAIINTSKPPFDDVRVRRALSYALDQQALIDVVAGKGATKPRKSYYPPESKWHSDKADAAYPSFDVQKAKDQYNQYINDPKRSDGQPVGTPISFRYECTAIPSLQTQAQAYQQMWDAVGFKVDLGPVEQSTLIQNVLSGKETVNCWRQGSDTDPYTYLSSAHGDPAKNPGDFTRFSPPDLQALLPALKTGKTFDERYKTLEQIQLIIANGAPTIWTGGNNEFVATQKNVNGVTTWKNPDGKTGDGAHLGVTMPSQLWKS